MAETKADIERERDELRAQLEAAQQATEAPAAPALENGHVITAMHAILGELGVKKSGQLPPNMGGKPYISAVDLNYGVKELMVREGLIIAPHEKMLEYRLEETKGRINTYMVIEGTYTIISSVDKSSVTITGIGDGIAAGSAVTSNIASTNALKNALLRTFLVTEQSTEDAAKNGPGEAAASTGDRAQQAAQKPTVRQPAGPPQAAAQPESDYKRRIREDFIDTGVFTKEQVNTVMDTVKAIEEFRGTDKLLPEVHRRLATGEVPE